MSTAARPVGKRKRFLRRLARVALGLTLVLVVVRVWPREPLAHRFVTSTTVYARQGELLRLTLAADEQYRVWVPLKDIAPALLEATLLYEDRYFFWHPGINPVALGRAIISTLGDDRMGASTVTMQLARRVADIDSGTFGGKLMQMGSALSIEARYGKREILEAYLNTVPYGSNIVGVGAASLIYFGKPVAELGLVEVLTLAVIPQNPNRRGTPLSQDGAESEGLSAARLRLATAYLARHPEARSELVAIFSSTDRARGRQAGGPASPASDEKKTPVIGALGGRRDLPFRAPHFVDQLLLDPYVAAGGQLRATLDLRLQRLLERQVKRYVGAVGFRGIHNAAALLVDTRDMGVVAVIGSADYDDANIMGQVNGTTSRRSPGSTLKPFVYALAMDQGVIHPLSVLKDVPTSFSAFSPENFDGRFVGPLTAQDALVRSRNVPALSLAAKLGGPSLYEFLVRAGVRLPEKEAHYGLGLATGGGEVTMEELVMLYAALANRGVLRPLRRLEQDPQAAGIHVISEEAAFLTLSMLRENPRPDRTHSSAAVRNRLRPAWKTGTSWGFRDAWSVGIVGPYVLAVWLGDFSGQGHPSLVGASAAAPLFFSVADALEASDRSLTELPRWRPAGLSRESFCSVSGALPGPHCHELRTGWYIPGRSPLATCKIHREVAIDAASGRRACGASTGPVNREVFEVWPTDLLKLFAAAGMPRRSPPPPGPGCHDELADGSWGLPPEIKSPKPGMTYTVSVADVAGDTSPLGRRGPRAAVPSDAMNTVAFMAETDGAAQNVFWYVDRDFVGRTRGGGSLFWTLRPGAFLVRAVDEQGRSDARQLKVDLRP